MWNEGDVFYLLTQRIIKVWKSCSLRWTNYLRPNLKRGVGFSFMPGVVVGGLDVKFSFRISIPPKSLHSNQTFEDLVLIVCLDF
ncbi:hypothetical protein ACFX1X_029128 [Malus domestica]